MWWELAAVQFYRQTAESGTDVVYLLHERAFGIVRLIFMSDSIAERGDD